MSLSASEIAAAAGAASAVAAWLSARASRQAVASAHRPFVWPELDVRYEGHGNSPHLRVGVKLRSDGPGTAFDGSCSIDPDLAPTSFRYPRRWFSRRVISGLTTPPVRAMRPGVVFPATGDDDPDRRFAFTLVSPEDVWWAVARWTDAAGVRWEFYEPSDPGALALPPRRLRRRRRRLRHLHLGRTRAIW